MAIADLTETVPIGSALDLAAREQGFTIYNATSAIWPMLPRDLSESQATLTAGLDRPVILISLELNPDLEVTHRRIERSTLSVDERLSHATALSGANRRDEIGARLRDGFALAGALARSRASGGALSSSDLRPGTDDERAVARDH